MGVNPSGIPVLLESWLPDEGDWSGRLDHFRKVLVELGDKDSCDVEEGMVPRLKPFIVLCIEDKYTAYYNAVSILVSTHSWFVHTPG